MPYWAAANGLVRPSNSIALRPEAWTRKLEPLAWRAGADEQRGRPGGPKLARGGACGIFFLNKPIFNRFFNNLHFISFPYRNNLSPRLTKQLDPIARWVSDRDGQMDGPAWHRPMSAPSARGLRCRPRHNTPTIRVVPCWPGHN